MLAALARLLPMIEALAARGGTSAALGGGTGGGILESLGGIMGGVQGFKSEAELGGALRQISDLSAKVDAAREAMAQNRQQQESIAAKAREDEKNFAFSDPAHVQQLATLARQQQAHQDSIRRAQQQASMLEARATITTDPRAAQISQLSRAGAIYGAGAAVANMAPSMIRNSPPVQIAANMAQGGTNLSANATTPTTGAIISGMAGSASNIFGRLGPGNMASSVFNRGPMGPLEELAKSGVELTKLPKQLADWSDALVESHRSLSNFNGALAKMFAQREVRGIHRGMASGERVGADIATLDSSLQDLYDTLQPMKDQVTIGLSRGLTSVVDYLVRIAKAVETLASETQRRVLGMTQEQYAAYLESFAKTERMTARNNQVTRAINEVLRRDASQRRGVPKR